MCARAAWCTALAAVLAAPLAPPTPDDNRITFGCINLPAAFYDAYVKPALGNRQGVVYVLPEVAKANKSLFDFL